LWLGLEPFCLLLTVTSAKWTHPEALAKRIEHWIIRSMNERYFGKSWRRRPWKSIQFAIAIERHKSGNPHAHVLLRFPSGLPRDFPVRYWQDRASDGGFCKLEVPRSQSDVVDYCSKYVVKEGEILLSENFRPTRVQPDLFDAKKAAASGSRFVVDLARDEELRIEAMLESDG
jgi:hypothetical protein